MSDIGIVIVTYNSAAEIGGCLDAAMRTQAEIVVVDNASTDNTIAEVARRGIRLIANSSNRGFAAAVNQGFAVLRCKHILLLNPDAEIRGSIDALARACEFPGAAAAGGKLLDSDGHLQIGFIARSLPTPMSLSFEALLINRIWPGNAVNRRYRRLDLDYSRLAEVEQPAGAFLTIRRDVWEKLRGFDENFFPLWFEDVDFCRRARDQGYRLYYVPDAVAKHTGGHSITQLTVEKRNIYWYRSLLRYSAKHFRPAMFRMVCLAILAGSLLRLIAAMASQWSLRPMGTYAKVARLACRSLALGWRDETVPCGFQEYK